MGAEHAGLGDADFELGRDGVAIEDEGLTKGFDDGGSECGGVGFSVGAVEENHEFRAHEVGGERGFRQEGMQTGGGFNEEGFAAAGAEGLVDLIEAVEGDGEDRKIPVGMLEAALDAVLKVIEEEGAVRQTGEGIGHAALGLVFEGASDVGDAAGGIAGDDAPGLDPAPRALGVLDAMLVGNGFRFAEAESAEFSFEASLIVGMDARHPRVDGGAGYADAGDGLPAG